MILAFQQLAASLHALQLRFLRLQVSNTGDTTHAAEGIKTS